LLVSAILKIYPRRYYCSLLIFIIVN